MLRLATGIPLGLVMVFLHACPRAFGEHFLAIFFLPLSYFTQRELFTLLGLRNGNGQLSSLAQIGLFFGTLLMLLGHFGYWMILPVWGALLVMTLLGVQIRRFPTTEPFLREPGLVALGTLWVAGGMASVFALRDLGEGWVAAGWMANPGFNPIALIPVFGCWCYDSCALGSGAATGKTPLAPHISPNKSLEGLVGGVAGGALGMVLLVQMVDHFAPPATAALQPVISWPLAALIGATLGLCSQLGDLVMSCVKREAHVKDSSNLIPSQGGLLDKADGYLFVAPVALGMLYLLLNVL